MDLLTSAFFWVTLAQIMMINIVLSGDNAVVIALASRAGQMSPPPPINFASTASASVRQ